jgi:DNA modification methylase
VKAFFEQGSIRILNGDCRELLRALPEKSVNTCVTSPPYWNLRDYAVAGQIGLEKSPSEYVAELVGVFREVRRVLRDDGTLWINIGDCYNAYNGNRGPAAGVNKNHHEAMPNLPAGYGLTDKSLKPKDLIGIPWMLAFALRADGWYLRADHVWGKPNGMPESVEDRPTRSHEYVFLLSKSARYYFDAEAVRTAPKASTETRLNQNVEAQIGSLRANGGEKTNGTMKAVGRKNDKQRGHSRRHAGFNDRWDQMERDEQIADGANLRSVWWISPAQYADAHFAVMPEKLATICVLAGCPDGGTVLDPFCGAGTTPFVCQQQAVGCVGIELNPNYCEMMSRRLAQANLFGGAA